MPRDTPTIAHTPPVVVVTFGRGNTGKTSVAMEMVWRAHSQGRTPVIVDGDKRSEALSKAFPEALRPVSEDPIAVKAMIKQGFDIALSEQRSIIFDFGTQDRPFVEFGKDLDLLELCEEAGMVGVAVYCIGPDPEDLLHAHSIWKSGFFRPSKSLLIMNEGVIRQGYTTEGAFKHVETSPLSQEMVKGGVKPILMTRLSLFDIIKELKISLYDALKPDCTNIGPTDKFTGRQWLKRLNDKRKEFLECLP